MATEIRMPAFSTSMTEGGLARWLKKEGDAVKSGEPIAEVETDKAVVDLEAPGDGVIGRIVVPEGTHGVKVEQVVAIMVAPGEQVREISAAAPPASATVIPIPVTVMQDAVAIPAAAVANAGRIFASPLARRIAAENGVELGTIAGTGPNGRIVRHDVDAAMRVAKPAPALVPAAAAPPAPAPARPAADGAYEEIPNSAMRKVIAQRLTESKQAVPHFYLTIDVAIDELLALRKQINQDLADARISVNDFIVKAVAIALRKVPAANASWTDNAIRRYQDVDISVAVATPSGLITPVVKNADARTLSAISAEIRELAARAKENRLKPHEYQGGGFTISNLGMYGVRQFAAIINPPQACILAVGAGEQRPVVRDGALAVATMMTCTLSVDHRVVDGAVGAEFLAAFKALMEKPMSMLV